MHARRTVLIRARHYLGLAKLYGPQLKQIAISGDRLVAWTLRQPQSILYLVVGNIRFLLLTWCWPGPTLQVLSLTLRQLPRGLAGVPPATTENGPMSSSAEDPCGASDLANLTPPGSSLGADRRSCVKSGSRHAHPCCGRSILAAQRRDRLDLALLDNIIAASPPRRCPKPNVGPLKNSGTGA